MTTLDRYDLNILRHLQDDGSLSNQELAERVGLTAAPCSRRVKQLEEEGVIRDRVVRISDRAVNLNLTALLHISMDKHIPERFAEFELVRWWMMKGMIGRSSHTLELRELGG